MFHNSALVYRYDRKKGIFTSVLLNGLFVASLLTMSGSLNFNFGHKGSASNKQTISIKKFNIKTAPQEVISEEEVSEESKVVAPEQEEIITKENPAKPSEIAQNQKKDKIEQKNSSQKKQAASSAASSQEAQGDTESNSEDTNPVTEPSRFGFNNMAPQYPIISFQLGESGDVTIEYVVGADGLIKHARVIESSKYPRLDRSALYEFRKWQFKPAKNITGKDVDSLPRTITFSFNIKTQEIQIK